MSTAIQIIALVISAVTLAYLIKYVGATEIIARQSIRQVEATFRPALVCVPGPSLDDGPTLVNIGMGPAMEIEWHFSTTRDRIPYLVADRAHHPLRHFPGMKPLFETTMPIVINYKSILEKKPMTQGTIRREVFSDHRPSALVAHDLARLQQLKRVELTPDNRGVEVYRLKER